MADAALAEKDAIYYNIDIVLDHHQNASAGICL